MSSESLEQADLVLYNTMSRRLEVFQPRGDGIRMFTCGPSVYNQPHIGNFRTYLFQDILQRYLHYLGLPVQRVINFTDIEDKAVAEAKRRGIHLLDLTRENEKRFLRDADQLGILLPEAIPKSSTSVQQAVNLIQQLLALGHAYWHQNCVFFDPLTVPGFGRLYGLDLSRWPGKRIRFWKDTYPGQRWNLGDFILWHGARHGESSAYAWDTEIGRGRPAWNIQDPAMISKHLGYELDICCGGVDNLYRHHDYNIAVMEAVSGKELAPYWMHTEHLLVRGAKMSKSKGNIIYPQDMFREGTRPDELRFYLLSVHYRSKMSLTPSRLSRAKDRLNHIQDRIRTLKQGAAQASTREQGKSNPDMQHLRVQAEKHLSRDLDVPGAAFAIEQGLKELLPQRGKKSLDALACQAALEELERIDQVLGFLGLADTSS